MLGLPGGCLTAHALATHTPPSPRRDYNFHVRAVSLSTALDALLAGAQGRAKVAEISTSPRTFFVHVRVPAHVAHDLRAVQEKVIPDASKRAEIDHVTLVYTRKPLDDYPPEKVHAALEALREVGERAEPIDAKIQGWGFFDGASKDGKTSTALVALLDAPGLEHLHVDMSRALEARGIEPSDNHVFTPHITFGFLGEGGRVETALPTLEGRFTIDRAHVASRDHHEIPLTGRPAPTEMAKAASLGFFDKIRLMHRASAMRDQVGDDAFRKSLFVQLKKDRDERSQPDPSTAKSGALGEQAAVFSMNPQDVQRQRHDAPGNGETSPAMAKGPTQGSC